MIVTRLMGGLGNQMFQYAAARALALRHGVEVRIDLSYLEHQHPSATLRSYGLGCFRLEASFATQADLRWARYGDPDSGGARLVDAAKTLLRPRRLKVVQQRGFGFDRRLLHAGPNSLLVGYWQSEDYFSDAADVIRDHFQLRELPSGETLKLVDAVSGTNAVSTHVRRGDYVNDVKTRGFHGNLSREWYAAAAEKIAERVESPHFFVFSDDIEWCKRHLALPQPTTFVSRDQSAGDHEHLLLMSSCRHHVIANSSFSWWAAWLGSRSDKVVVAPAAWFADASIDTSRVTPSAWIRL